jgi:hypothetical protein
MVDDPRDPNEFNDNSGGGGQRPGGGGGGGLFNLLPLVLTLFRSKFGMAILVIGAILYFAVGRNGCGGLFSEVASGYATGGMLDPNEFAKAEVYEGLADDNLRNPLPEFVSLGKYAPQRQNQGRQGSCVAWSSAYAAQTILHASSTGSNPNQVAFSPAFMYNQIGLQGCQGSYIIRAMDLMKKQGGVPFNQFPYNERDCSTPPDNDLRALAASGRIHGYNRLTTSESPSGINIRAVKEHLAKEAPVVIGMMVGGSFMEGMMGKKVWQPTRADNDQMGFGGHAMCVIGYDDKLAGGAFQIMNSWGPEWGENGIGWVRYADFKQFVREAYGVDPLPKSGKAANEALDCEIGLVERDTKKYISLAGGVNNVFTSAPVKKGAPFKVEVKNSAPCYVYVFGQETDGSSYTLFPYPAKEDSTKTRYSPYCGITGYRLFPKDKSMAPDETGNKDYIAVVVSKQELDWFGLNKAISANRGNYVSSVSAAISRLGGAGRISVSSTGKGNMRFAAPSASAGVAYAIVEINKL